MNFTAGGEYCLFNARTSSLAAAYSDEFRKLLVLSDRNDVNRGTSVHPHSFVSSVMRATRIIYPNIGCTFKETASGKNENGVFNLDTTSVFTNEHSIIKADEPGPYAEDPDTWYLDDIIRTTYERTGTTKGIFLFAGCTSGFKQATKRSNLTGNIGIAISEAEKKIYTAEVRYRASVPTLDRSSIERINPDMIAKDYGTSLSLVQPDPTSMAALAAATQGSVKRLFSDIAHKDPENVKKAMSMLKP